MRKMRSFFFLVAAMLAVLAAPAAPAGAQVLRCEDAAGKVSYTDGSCPAGTRPQRRVSTQEPVSVLPDPQGEDRAARNARETAGQRPPAAPQPAPPTGAVIIDGRGGQPQERSDAQRWDGDLGGDPQVAADGYYPPAYPYPYPYAGAVRPPPPRDQRPPIRRCDPATGCTDRLGNNYNQNTGKLQRYQSIDGKTCSPVGTTVVCR